MRQPEFRYPSPDEEELAFIETHGRHHIAHTGQNWIKCATCGAVLRFTIRYVPEVLRSLGK